MIAAYLPAAREGGSASPREKMARVIQEHQDFIETLCKDADPAKVAEFRQRLAYARRNANFTDEHNHYIDQLAEGQYIQAMTAAGRWLAARSDLTEWGEVYWLHPAEVISALRSAAPQDFHGLLSQRRDQFAAWSRMSVPTMLGLPDPTLTAWTAESTVEVETVALEENALRGQTAARGVASGRARIAAESANLPDISPGDVLVAFNAGPLWTPVFPILAGLVLDSGNIGDHAAITAREFGVPAVFTTGSATTRIPEGAWVTVDGSSGQVHWKNKTV
jgi:pyruvate,water dikinase